MLFNKSIISGCHSFLHHLFLLLISPPKKTRNRTVRAFDALPARGEPHLPSPHPYRYVQEERRSSVISTQIYILCLFSSKIPYFLFLLKKSLSTGVFYVNVRILPTLKNHLRTVWYSTPFKKRHNILCLSSFSQKTTF